MSYQLTSSIRYDQNLRVDDNDADGPVPFLLLKYHYDRLSDAADRHGWKDAKAALSYDYLKATCEKCHEGIRVLLTKEGVLTATTSKTYNLPSDPFIAARFRPDSAGNSSSIRIDTQPTPSSVFTATKTTRREHYDAARSRVNLLPLSQATATEDVLLYNTEGEVTESSASNIALYRGGKWLTPPLSTGCLRGVIRRWLLEHDLVVEAEKGDLMKDTINAGDWVLLSNGVSGCRLGRIEI
ncbi:aminotransferase [Amanita rubescens]|nr:aminotransferase [Amanita rubescens]